MTRRGRAEELVGERRTLESVIYDELHARIVSLEYPPGLMIFENEVAAEFGVSRTPVRQAFFRLAKDDLLEVLPQRGARVSFISKEKVRESQVVRESLEVTSMILSVRKWDEDDPDCRAAAAEIEEIIANQVKAVAAGDDAAFTRLDEEYHRAFMRFAGNMTLFNIVCEIRAHLNRVRYAELQVARLDDEAVVYHREIFDAVRAKDEARAVECLRAHLRVLEDFREEIFAKRKDMFI